MYWSRDGPGRSGSVHPERIYRIIDEFSLPGVAENVARMKSAEEREKCETQIAIVTKYIQDISS